MKRFLTLFPATLFFFASIIPAPSFAEIYKWVDADGKTHFGDKQDDKSANTADAAEVVEVKEGNAYVAKEAMTDAMRQDLEKMTQTRHAAEEKARIAAHNAEVERKAEQARQELKEAAERKARDKHKRKSTPAQKPQDNTSETSTKTKASKRSISTAKTNTFNRD